MATGFSVHVPNEVKDDFAWLRGQMKKKNATKGNIHLPYSDAINTFVELPVSIVEDTQAASATAYALTTLTGQIFQKRILI